MTNYLVMFPTNMPWKSSSTLEAFRRITSILLYFVFSQQNPNSQEYHWQIFSSSVQDGMSRLARLGLQYSFFLTSLRFGIIIDRFDNSTTIEIRQQSLWDCFTAFMVVVAMAFNLVRLGVSYSMLGKLTFAPGGASYETGFCPHGGMLPLLWDNQDFGLLTCYSQSHMTNLKRHLNPI